MYEREKEDEPVPDPVVNVDPPGKRAVSKQAIDELDEPEGRNSATPSTPGALRKHR